MNLLIILILLVLLVLAGYNLVTKEGFELGPNLKHEPKRGKFVNSHLIGISPVNNITECKNICNKMSSCTGISVQDGKSSICRLYNDSQWVIPSNKFSSWKKFGDEKIY